MLSMQNREDMINALQRRIDNHVEQGKIQLQRAMDYLHDYCDVWYENNNQVWLDFLHNAETHLHKATELRELLAEIS